MQADRDQQVQLFEAITVQSVEERSLKSGGHGDINSYCSDSFAN